MRGFSLVELSIVLVILGLLTGGILAGQNLIRAAELRAVSTEYNAIITATQTFRDKYFALPGDMRNATAFWTEQASGAACATAASTTQATCDGDGNGQVVGGSGNTNESYRFWQHLANAGLLEGSYTGVQASTNSWSSSADNSLNSKFGNAIWFIWNWGGPGPGGTLWYAGEYGNRLSIGSFQVNGEPQADIMTPEEAWNIDTKIDDGMPGRGMIWVMGRTACDTSISTTDYAAEYDFLVKTKSCTVNFRNSF